MFSRLREGLRTSVRSRLLAIALLPLALALPGLLILVLYWGSTYYDRLLIFKVNSDLVVADQYFRRVLERVGRDGESLAQSHALVAHLGAGDAKELDRLLAWKGSELKLDFLVFHRGERSLGPGPQLPPGLHGSSSGRSNPGGIVYGHLRSQSLSASIAPLRKQETPLQ